MEDPDAQQVLLLGRRCQRNHSFAKASPHQVRERNCLEAGLTFSHLPLTPHPTEREKNLLLEGKSRVPPVLVLVLGGSVWPVKSGLRPLMAQVLLRDLEPPEISMYHSK